MKVVLIAGQRSEIGRCEGIISLALQAAPRGCVD